MRYLSAFTENTENQLTQLFDIAARIWPFADFNKVHVMADFVDGANYRARYLFFPGIVELSYKSRADVFDYIEVFYNRNRRHGYLGNISPVAFEQKTTGLYETVH